jgi:iron-sulfur cluster assembly protein
MITITPRAADQIRWSAQQSQSETLALRIAARITPEETIDYGMGFDVIQEDDIRIASQGIQIIVAPGGQELLHGVMIDYVELEPGEWQFIFHNPNDPNYKSPKDDPSLEYYEGKKT